MKFKSTLIVLTCISIIFLSLSQCATNKSIRDQTNLKPCTDVRSIGKIPQSLQWIANPTLDYISESEIKQHTVDNKCQLFSGVAYMVEKAESYQTEIKLVKVFVRADINKIDFLSLWGIK